MQLRQAHCTIVHVSQGDLFEDAPPVDAVVAAGNSFGYLCATTVLRAARARATADCSRSGIAARAVWTA